MVPKIHARGASFKGAAAYLLHDKGRASTATRVAWTETINLSTRNPETAWRVMAATALDAPRLKQRAGIKKTGRVSRDAVLHISLSWSPEQSPDRAEMTAFARRALAALKAEDRQAMLICHNDEKHPHLHLLVNRVSPNDGRLLSSSNEKSALSALALAYERESGEILCAQREQNAERRAKGEYVRGESDVPRDEFEALREAHEAAEADLPSGTTPVRSDAIAALRKQSLQVFRERLAALRNLLKPQWAGLYDRQREERSIGRQEKESIRKRVAYRVTGRISPNALSRPFLRQTFKGLVQTATSRTQRQQGERALLARSKRTHLTAIVHELKQSYAQALGKLRGAYGIAARPVTEGQEGRTFTPQELRVIERVKSLAAQKTPPHRPVKDREREP